MNNNKLKHNNPLTDSAYKILVDDLESYGNQLDQNHKDALYALVRTMSDMSQGKLEGRYAFSLPTGLGKTLGIIAWVTAMNKLGLNNISVSVSASKVEALCNLKKDLIAHGVPESKIGLLHSYQHDAKSNLLKQGYASLPSTGSDDRQIMLITHNRLRNGKPDKRYHSHKGKPRSLMLYDESLIKSDSRSINFTWLRSDIAAVVEIADEQGVPQEFISFILKAKSLIQSMLQELKDHPDDDSTEKASVIELDPLSENELNEFKREVNHAHHLTRFLEVCQQPLRISSLGIISYQLAVSPEIKNILILDASYPIRELIQLDESIKDAQETLPYLKSLNVKLSQLKRFDNVTVKQMYASGSRGAMTDQFNRYPNDRHVVNDACSIIKSVPDDESILIFTFKDRNKNDRFTEKLIQGLQKSGIDCDATVTLNDERRKRINIVTWGSETSLNDFNHCEHVILLGVLHRSTMDLASYVVGQSNDLTTPLNDTEITQIQKSEITHLIYQAASRGSCRTIKNGYAEPMALYLIDKDKDIQSSLEAVMPHLNYGIWDGEYITSANTGLIIDTAKIIYNFLKTTAKEHISIRELKTTLQLNGLHNSTFKEARDYCLRLLTLEWKLNGRSLEHMTYGFSDEST